MFRAPTAFAVLAASLLVLYPRFGSGSAEVLDSRCGTTRTGLSPQTLGPWTALLHANGRIACAGTLIHRRFILTAAHCLKRGEALKVRLGVYGRVGAEQPENYDVDVAFRHRHYNNQTLENDIGLMRLSRPVQYKVHIRPICIVLDPSAKYLSLIDTEILEFSGTAWDRTGQARYQDIGFHAINISRIQCQNGPKAHDALQFCGSNRKANDFCDGPSGSALSQVMQGFTVQLGIASYSDLDCQSTRVYTDVTRYSEWILKIVHFYGGSLDQRTPQPVVVPNGSTKSSHSATTPPPRTNIQENRQMRRRQ